MRKIFLAGLGVVCLSAGMASAACTGSNGRGWASGQGNGSFEMTSADKTCQIGFPGFVDSATNARTPATEMQLTKAPSSGTLGLVAGRGVIYTPKAGFKGQDQFCTRNTAKGMQGTLSGCVTITVK